MTEHDPFIREAIALSQSAVANGNHPFGAVLVKDGQVLLRAENNIFTASDPTGHAETNLVRLAGAAYSFEFLHDCVLYTSTEPCPMCSAAIFWSGIRQVVYACSAARLDTVGDVGFNLTSREVFARARQPVMVIGPVLEDEAMRVHEAFWPVQ
ncbi:MAG TPA: nucleoside deaminase [Candidatus Limnocylindrales bacterium]|nr:nucleoside deaminase [Candidatus Limnocylindrales bacterium]